MHFSKTDNIYSLRNRRKEQAIKNPKQEDCFIPNTPFPSNKRLIIY